MTRPRPAALAALVAAVVCTILALAWPEPRPDLLLVADLRGEALVVVDPTQPEAARRIPLPGGPHELLRLPDGRIAVSLEQSGAIAVVDVVREEVDVLDVGGTPHGLALDGDTLLLTDRSSDAVRRFAIEGAAAAWRELAPVPVEEWPHAVGVLPGGDLVVANAGAGTLAIGAKSLATGPVTETLAVAAGGARIATASAYDGTVSVFTPTGDLLARHDVGGRPVRVLYSPDGDTIAVALSAAHAVALVQGGAVRTVAVMGVPDGLAFSSDGRVLFASDVYGGAVTAVDVRDAHVSAVLRPGVATGALMALAR